MTTAFPERHFQVWLFRVSHGQLLIRSPKDATHKRNIDLMFVGVEYMDLPRRLMGLGTDQPTEQEVLRASERVGKSIDADSVTILISEGRRYMVVAGFSKVAESDMDIFDHPFE